MFSPILGSSFMGNANCLEKFLWQLYSYNAETYSWVILQWKQLCTNLLYPSISCFICHQHWKAVPTPAHLQRWHIWISIRLGMGRCVFSISSTFHYWHVSLNKVLISMLIWLKDKMTKKKKEAISSLNKGWSKMVCIFPKRPRCVYHFG